MCFLVRLQEGKPKNLATVSDSFSTNADINGTIFCGSEGMLLDSLHVPECLSSIQMMTEVHWKCALHKDRMIHKIIKIVDFPVVCLVMLLFL